jgi:hypothetical protein
LEHPDFSDNLISIDEGLGNKFRDRRKNTPSAVAAHQHLRPGDHAEESIKNAAELISAAENIFRARPWEA